jgi:hypothetical protein
LKTGGGVVRREELEAEAAAREAYDQQQDRKLETLNGHYYPLDGYDFGKTLDVKTPNSDDVALLTTYAMTMEGIDDPAEIIENTVIKNEFDGVEFVWNAVTQAWTDWGEGNIVTAGNDHLGVVEGTADPGDGSKDGYVTVHPGGTMRALGVAALKTRMDAAEGNIAAKLDKRTSGVKTMAYTHTGAGQGEIEYSMFESADTRETLVQRGPDGTINIAPGTSGNHGVNYTQLVKKADKESPGFTGVPTAPTATEGTNTDQIATAQFVNKQIAEHNDDELSHNDLFDGKVDKNGTDRLMTAAEGTKLSGIADGAQVNPGAATTSEAGLMSAADKTKLNGVAAGAQVNPGAATTSAAGLMSVADKVKLDGVAAGAQVNPGNATQSAAGLMSAADKTKLDGTAAGAQVNVLEGVQLDGADIAVSGKKVNIVTDASPTADSVKPARSGGVKTAIDAAIDAEESARDAAIGAAIAAEESARNAAIAEAKLSMQIWLKAVATKAELPDPQTLVADINYLCRVMSDTVATNNGVWQRIAGTTVWSYFSDNLDFIDETELAAAISGEATARNTAIAAAVKTTLADAAASDVLPTITSSTFASLFQTIRNCLKWLVGKFNVTTGHVHNGTDSPKIGYANVTGTPTIPVKTTKTPVVDGTAAIGDDTGWATGNHVHPTDTSRAPANVTLNDAAASTTLPAITSTTMAALLQTVRNNLKAIFADAFVTDTRMGNRTLTDAAADSALVPVAEKTLTAWLQSIRNNLKALFGYFTNGIANSAAKWSTARTVSLSGDVTGSASLDGSANAAIAATLAASGVTAGAYGPAAAATPGFGGTFKVPQVTVDAKGRATSIVDRDVTLPANPNTDNRGITQLTGDVTAPLTTNGPAVATLANSGVTDGSYGDGGDTRTLAFSGTFKVPKTHTVDKKGRVTAAEDITLTLPAAPTSVSGNAGTATKLATKRTIAGVSFDGSEAITHFATCSTAAATVAKTVALSNFSLVIGAEITITFTVTNTAANPTLNVNATGAKPIYYRNAAISAGDLAANRTYRFVYDGTQYELIGDLDTSTTYAVATTGANGLMSANDKTKLDSLVSSATAIEDALDLINGEAV